MKSFLKDLVLGLCLVCAGELGAATVAIDIDTSKPKRYVVAISVAADGTITFEHVPLLASLKPNGDGPVKPTDPPPPTTGTLEQRLAAHKALVKDELDKVTGAGADKEKTMLTLQEVYIGALSLPQTTRADLLQFTDIIFNALPLTAHWTVWRGNVHRSLATFKTLEEARKAWQVTADALGGK